MATRHRYFLRSTVAISGSVLLEDLPNEVLLMILSYLDPRSLLCLRAVRSKRLKELANDHTNWSTISWTAACHKKDVKGLILGLTLSKGALRKLSVEGWHFKLSQFLRKTLTCNGLWSISLTDVAFTEEDMIRLLSLPSLTHLCLRNSIDLSLFKVISANSVYLKHLCLRVPLIFFANFVHAWSVGDYLPPSLQILGNLNEHLFRGYILNLPPSLNHTAYLSFCENLTEGIVPELPYFQYSFAPNPTIPLSASPCGERLLALTGSPPDYVTAQCDSFEGLDVTVDYKCVCRNLRTFRCGAAVPGHLLASMPNLTELFIVNSMMDDRVQDLASLATFCPKLRVLNIRYPDKLQELWQVVSMMENLRVLVLDQCQIIPANPVPSSFPKLTVLKLNGLWHERTLDFISHITSLRVLVLDTNEGIMNGWARLLHSCNLTHLCVSSHGGLGLPADPSCYTNMEKLLVADSFFVFKTSLANALAKAEKLSVLMMEISSCDLVGVKNIVAASKSLSRFHIYLDECGMRKKEQKQVQARMRRALRKQLAYNKERIIDMKIQFGGYADCSWLPTNYHIE